MARKPCYETSGTVFLPDDPVGQSTEWTPLVSGGASFRTRRLVTPSPERLEFRPTAGFLLFGACFLIPGAVAFGAGGWLLLTGSYDWQGALFLLLWGALFGAAGGLLLYFGCRRVVFDFADGEFRRGVRRGCGTDSPHCVSLTRIHALQIVAEYCSGSKGGSFISYELNLVLKDGSRRNVVDHGNLKKLRADAAVLCERLKLPLWDNGDAPCRRTGWKKIPPAGPAHP